MAKIADFCQWTSNNISDQQQIQKTTKSLHPIAEHQITVIVGIAEPTFYSYSIVSIADPTHSDGSGSLASAGNEENNKKLRP